MSYIEWASETVQIPRGQYESLKGQVADQLDEIQRLRGVIRNYKIKEYKWQCSGCRAFTTNYRYNGTCPHCGRVGYLTGSVNYEEREKWVDALDGDSE